MTLKIYLLNYMANNAQNAHLEKGVIVMLQESLKHQEFNELVTPYLRSLKNTSLRLTRDEMESEDLLQEALYRAYKGLNTFQRDTNFRAWIFRILINVYITHYRRSVKQPQKVSYDDMEEYALFPQVDNPSDFYTDGPGELSGEHFADEVLDTLRKLPYYFRLVVLLYDVEGFSYKEISEMVNIPVGTVMSRLNRGRSLLRRKLKRYARENGYLSQNDLEMGFAG